MGTNELDLFRLAETRLAWIERRQEVLAQNIANLDTPGYQARDLPDFSKTLAQASLADAGAPVRTNPMHLAGTAGTGTPRAYVPRPIARAPDGNAVSLEQEMTKVADAQTQHELVTNLYKTYLGMFRTALGRG